MMLNGVINFNLTNEEKDNLLYHIMGKMQYTKYTKNQIKNCANYYLTK